MVAIPTEIEVQPERRNSRANEIVVIALIAAALLLGLCLASYHPNDPSWNAVGETSAQNWIGTVGANVAAALFQAIGFSLMFRGAESATSLSGWDLPAGSTTRSSTTRAE